MEPPAEAPVAAAATPPLPSQDLQETRCSPADVRAPCGFAKLPRTVLIRVFAALPVDARAACARVCAPWREVLLRDADAWRLWTRLDLTRGSGVRCTVSEAAVVGAAALARGRLQELNLSGRGGTYNFRDNVTRAALSSVLRSSPELRELAVNGIGRQNHLDPYTVQALAAEAPPTLQRLHVQGVLCYCADDSLPLLRAEPPFGSLSVQTLTLDIAGEDEAFIAVADARSFGAAVTNARLRELVVKDIKRAKPAALEVLVDALLARTCRVQLLEVWSSGSLTAACLPALTRLLAGGDGAALADVSFDACPSLFSGASAAAVEAACAALRCSTLTSVGLHGVGLTQQALAALRQAAAANPRLHLRLGPGLPR